MFHVESAPEREFPATIFAVGNTFEEDPKAVSVHAEILGDKPKSLLPGMYVRGRILLDEAEALALPAEAVVRDGDDHFIIGVEEAEDGSKVFEKYQISKGKEDAGYVEIIPVDELPTDGDYVYTNAYFILSDMMEMGGHSH
jgi:cobalt-zinc-cadmium efflux system membrane fusion protein